MTKWKSTVPYSSSSQSTVALPRRIEEYSSRREGRGGPLQPWCTLRANAGTIRLPIMLFSILSSIILWVYSIFVFQPVTKALLHCGAVALTIVATLKRTDLTERKLCCEINELLYCTVQCTESTEFYPCPVLTIDILRRFFWCVRT